MPRTKRAQTNTPAVLCILDGFGIAPEGPGNAITKARTPHIDHLITTYPAMTVRASAEAVGLEWGENGNSEVGHLTIGAGRVVRQVLPQIDEEVKSGVFFTRPVLKKIKQHLKKTKGTLHLVGLLSDGDVHASDRHVAALIEFAAQNELKDVMVHTILDGRDVLYDSATEYLGRLRQTMKELGVGKLASVSGRFYAMDRDRRWGRTQWAYDAIMGRRACVDDILKALQASYKEDIYDERFVPVCIKGGKPVKKGDAVLFWNYRADRMRQMVDSFTEKTFDAFETESMSGVLFASMTAYEEKTSVLPIYERDHVSECLAEVLAREGLSQIHIAETEKYAHVTYFLNGKHETPFKGEDRLLIPSPSVSHYETTPEMSAKKITKAVLEDLAKKKHDVIIINFANTDLVAHSGNMSASIKAVEAIDTCLKKVTKAVLEANGVMIVTADHGNIEEVVKTRTNDIDKEHSTSPVPVVIVGEIFEGKVGPTGEVFDHDLSTLPPAGELSDIAPTFLDLLGIKKPSAMSGRSLLDR